VWLIPTSHGLRLLRDEGPAALVYGNFIAAAVALPVGIGGPTPTPLDLGLVLYLGVFQLGLAYLCFSRGLLHTPAVEASLLALIEPVLNPIWTFLAAGERPGPWALAGGAVVLAATAWRTLAPVVAARRAAAWGSRGSAVRSRAAGAVASASQSGSRSGRGRDRNMQRHTRGHRGAPSSPRGMKTTSSTARSGPLTFVADVDGIRDFRAAECQTHELD
jgi:hypothetical protein